MSGRMELGRFSGKQAWEAVRDVKLWCFMLMGVGIYVWCVLQFPLFLLFSAFPPLRMLELTPSYCAQQRCGHGFRHYHHQVLRAFPASLFLSSFFLPPLISSPPFSRATQVFKRSLSPSPAVSSPPFSSTSLPSSPTAGRTPLLFSFPFLAFPSSSARRSSGGRVGSTGACRCSDVRLAPSPLVWATS
jgi:hypothetical protein